MYSDIRCSIVAVHGLGANPQCAWVAKVRKDTGGTGDSIRRLMSSAYPKRALFLSLLPSEKRGCINSMKRIGDVGDPCGSPDWICTVAPVSPSRRTAAECRDTKLATQHMIFNGQPCSLSLRMRRSVQVCEARIIPASIRTHLRLARTMALRRYPLRCPSSTNALPKESAPRTFLVVF